MFAVLINKTTQLALLIAIVFATNSYGETNIADNSVTRIENYNIYHSIFNSSFVSPEVAKAYGLVRSDSKALINLSIIKTLKDGSTQSITGTVTGTYSDLIHTKALDFKKVQEQTAIYYLATIDIEHKATTYFKFFIKVAGRETPLKVEFSKKLYQDGRDG